MKERISIVGLGKLGLCLAACYAERGFETLGVDTEERVVNCVNHGKSPWFEPGLEELLAKHGGKRLRATSRHPQAIEETDITFLLLATPSQPDGTFSNRFIESALHSLAKTFGQSRKKFHDFVISSTVMPGSTEGQFLPLLEKQSGRKRHQDFGMCYVPDFVALGNVIQGYLRPDLVVIGESSPEAGSRIEALHRSLCENQPVLSRMSLISAEIAKICLNAYVTTKISFTNSIANLCEQIPGADVDAVTKAIGADRRISPYYFQGGLAFGGTCFPRDTRLYMAVAEKFGVPAEIILAVDRVNQYQNQHLFDVVIREVEPLENKTVGVLGLSFTANTPVVTESPALKLITRLLESDKRVVVYDPLAIDNTRSIFGSAVEYLDSVEQCLAQSGLAVLTLRDPRLAQAVEAFTPPGPLTLVDCWRIVDPVKLHKNYTYLPLGRSRT